MDKNLCKFTQVFFSGDKIELSIKITLLKKY